MSTPEVRAGRAARVRGERGAGPFLRAMVAERNGKIGAVLLGLVVLLSLVAIVHLTPYNPVDQHPSDQLTGPSGGYWFGTDQFGRDIFSRTLAGLATSMRVAVLAVALASVLGSVIGICAGYFGGWLDQVVGRLTDVLFAFPAILLALAVVTALGRGWFNTAIAIAVVYTPIFVRVSRGPTLGVAGSEYVQAAHVLGLPAYRILRRHVLPNVAAPIVVQVALALSWALLTESALSFLGLGTQPPEPSLGAMVSEARNQLTVAWWTMTFPALAIVLAVIGCNLLGDGLRSALDPRRSTT